MVKHVVFVSVLLLVLMLALTESSPRMCCTQYNEKPIPVKFLKYYKVQEMRGYCNIKAVVFTTLKNRFVCANPNSKWVQRAMESVPEYVSFFNLQVKKST
ncbi:C-C motif chemokine 26 [Cynoglossus semilaevis]|uniref:C-C motif chemokine 26 n=1 Tax=Cynoglossus semilaevis TaxID=244447 RepID=UPI000494EB7E|nr:C-C motif chemokine 26-like [Cynoglossus semilaevis]